MNKKRNTILFLLAGTAANVIIMIICFIIIYVFYDLAIRPILPEAVIPWILLLIFPASIVSAFFIYRGIIKLISNKIDMEKYFDPIFGNRRRPPRKDN